MVSPTTIAKVLQKAIEVSTHSWEYGTVAEALLEHYNASLSVFHDPFPNNRIPKLAVADVPSLSYVKPFIRTDNVTLVDGDGAAGDPAALGVSAILIGQTSRPYYDAAVRQAEHLLNAVPRWGNGAISHRESHPELWADFVYMAPPFLAYYGVAIKNVGILKEAAHQCEKYAEVLKTESGAWLHIVGQPDTTNDRKLWSTGNGWAAAGMARVLATMRKSSFKKETRQEQQALVGLIKNIVDGSRHFDTDSSGLLRNYLNITTWFGEISGTSLIAATVFRMAVLEPKVFDKSYTDWAKAKMKVVYSKIDKDTGIVAPAVNPLDWGDTRPFVTGSPEGQSFVVLLDAAHRDWKK